MEEVKIRPVRAERGLISLDAIEQIVVEVFSFFLKMVRKDIFF